eukprot:scaffold68809_cov69-Phaeocystis_antarctica.AAC.1
MPLPGRQSQMSGPRRVAPIEWLSVQRGVSDPKNRPEYSTATFSGIVIVLHCCGQRQKRATRSASPGVHARERTRVHARRV